MTISDKTRKMLWGRSGNRCAICRVELVMASSGGTNNESVVGDECHIVAREFSGPRGESDLSVGERDSYDNLILLCKIHHKVVDDQPTTFTAEVLQTLKEYHENWVRSTLSTQSKYPNQSDYFIVLRVRSGEQLFQTLGGAYAYYFHNDDLFAQREVDLVGDFFQNLQDCLDLWDELEAKARIRTQFEFSQTLQLLETNGFLVYASTQMERKKLASSIEPWPVAYVLIFRQSKPIVLRKDEQIEQLFEAQSAPTNQYTNFIRVGRSKDASLLL